MQSVPSQFSRSSSLDPASRAEEQPSNGPWLQYFQRLSRFLQTRLPANSRRNLDAEDLAASTLRSYFSGNAQANNSASDDLWPLLKTIAQRKVSKGLRHLNAQKRGGGRVRGESIFGAESNFSLGAVAINPQTPFAEILEDEEVAHLLQLLPSDALRRIALLKSAGASVEDIATTLDCGHRTVERRLELIRRAWSHRG